ncbi:glutamate racemase [uncultured Algimonas sp.]|uniref:glutamate racemase n=1 Tax=uncultured Algimonas sp. TaxID=1547920 RepID=UPI00262100AA|nr:glutamate racemase [uncultured Algimonas sp.]
MTPSRPDRTSDPCDRHVLVFDSGVGGLSVSAAIRARLPDVAQTYLADDAFRPYGDKTEAQLHARIPSLLGTLCARIEPDLVVVACNTASTTALPAIRAALDMPVVGVVPAIKPAAAGLCTGSAEGAGGIGVLGTPGTVRRAYVDALIDRYASHCAVRLRGSVALVEEAERKLRGQAADPAVIAAEIAPLFRGSPISAVVLACTHFPLLRDELVAAAPYPVDWIDSGDAVARRVDSLLSGMNAPRRVPSIDGTAWLTAPNTDAARAAAFADYGFPRLRALDWP